ncbi:hypothetical protein [Clostridium sp.]|uniref:hypothetical protein n=1 Tax=Clostridium sp. TaxID=1506 RepID=UPI002FCB54F5
MSKVKSIKEGCSELGKEKKFKDILKLIVKPSVPSASMIIILVITYCAFLIFFNNIMIAENSCEITKELLEFTLNITLALFGIVFTGYALFQALTSKEMVTILLTNKTNDISLFKAYNLHFLKLSLVYLSIIISSFIFTIVIKSNFVIFLKQLEVGVKVLLISTYFLIVFYSYIEIKSFLFNIYQCFSVYGISMGIETINEIKKKEEEKEKCELNDRKDRITVEIECGCCHGSSSTSSVTNDLNKRWFFEDGI